MGLCFVTGVSGTGKSAVLGELRARGCLARGVDEDGYADWVSRRTGAAEVIPQGDPEFDIHAWYRAHDWVPNAELALIIGWHDRFAETYRRFGAVIVDATRPLHVVVDEALAAAPDLRD
jgi:hypothetical protein